MRLVLLLALLLRALFPLLAYAWHGDESAFLMGDSTTYLFGARSLVNSGAYIVGGVPELLRPPVYSLLLTPGVWLGAPVAFAIVVQCALGVLSVYLTYRCARRLFGREDVATFAALLLALDPLSVLYASKVLSETTATLLLLAGLHFLLDYFARERWAPLLAAAACLAAAALTRPIFYYLPLLFTAIVLVRALRERAGRYRRVLHAVLFLAAAATPLGAWQLRNHIVADYPRFTAFEDYNLYFVVSAALKAAREGRPFYEVHKEVGALNSRIIFARERALGRTQAEAYRAMGAHGWQQVREAPLTFASLHLRGVVRTLLDPASVEYPRLFKAYPYSGGLLREVSEKGLWSATVRLARERPGLLALSLVLGAGLVSLLLLALFGALSTKVWRTAGGFAVLAAAVYLIAWSGGPVTTHRFRHPMMPLFCMLAAAGALDLRARWRRRRGTAG